MIEQTIRQKLPDGFQTAEFLIDHGMLDLVEPRENLQRALAQAARAARARRSGAPCRGGAAGACPRPTARRRSRRRRARRAPPWDIVQLARHIDRPNTLEYVGFVFDDFQELHGDRLFDEDAAIVGGLGPARRPRRDGRSATRRATRPAR